MPLPLTLPPPPCSQNAFTDHTWINLTANAAGKVAGFVDWGWGVQACSKNGGSCAGLGVPDEAIFATMYAHAGDWDVAWDPDVHFVRSDDWFKSMKQKVSGRTGGRPAGFRACRALQSAPAPHC